MLIPCSVCGKKFTPSENQKYKYKKHKVCCSPSCRSKLLHKLHYKTGTSINAYGYVINNKTGRLQHREIIEQHFGIKLNFENIVHHKNGVKTDNRIENLEVLSRKEHSRIHMETKVTKICEFCGKEYKSYLWQKDQRKYCSKICFNNSIKQHHKAQCLYCGKKFNDFKCRKRKYCSQDCFKKQRRANRTQDGGH